MQVDGKQNAGAHQSGLQHCHNADGDGVALALKNGDLEQGHFKRKLPPDEEGEQYRANDDERDGCKHVVGGADGCQAVEQREQTQRAQGNGGLVEGGGLEHAVGLELPNGCNDDDHRKDEHQGEQCAPPDEVDQQAGDGRADRRREADDE